MKTEGEIEDLRIKVLKKKKKKKRRKTSKNRMIVKMVKIYLGLSLVLSWAVWGHFIFG